MVKDNKNSNNSSNSLVFGRRQNRSHDTVARLVEGTENQPLYGPFPLIKALYTKNIRHY